MSSKTRTITIKSFTGSITHIEFEANDPFLDFYDQLGNSTSVTKKVDDQPSAPWGHFFISVRLNPGKTISLLAQSSYTISDLMQDICYKEGVVPFKQSLYLAGEPLDKRRALSDYNICGGGCILDLVIAYRGELKIYVESFSGDEMLPLDVHTSMTIKAVKAEIHAKKGIPVEQQKLVYFGEQLEDDKMLFHYYIQNKSPILLVDSSDIGHDDMLQINVNLVAAGKTIHLQAKPSETIHCVKAKIQAEEGIPLSNQILFLPRLRLDNTSTLAESFIRDGSTLHVVQTAGPGQESDPKTTTNASIHCWNSGGSLKRK